MSMDTIKVSRFELLLAGLLKHGTWLASAIIATGLALALMQGRSGDHGSIIGSSMHIITIGIACLILLPVVRVAFMLVIFLKERDYRFAAIAAIVLTIIFAGIALGMHMAKTQAPAHSTATLPS